ncbi:hypothetical protein GCM10009603_42510 [Nocardiopsis exhalans]
MATAATSAALSGASEEASQGTAIIATPSLRFEASDADQKAQKRPPSGAVVARVVESDTGVTTGLSQPGVSGWSRSGHRG